MVFKKKKKKKYDKSHLVGGVLMLIGIFSQNLLVFGGISIIVFAMMVHSLNEKA